MQTTCIVFVYNFQETMFLQVFEYSTDAIYQSSLFCIYKNMSRHYKKWWQYLLVKCLYHKMFFKGADWCPPSRANQISFIHFLCLNYVAAIYFCVCKQYDYRFRPGEHTNNNGSLIEVTNMVQFLVFSFCLQTWTSSFVIFINHNLYSYVENSSFSSRNVQSFYNLCVLARPRPRPS